MLPVLLLNTQTFHLWLKLNTKHIKLPCKKMDALHNSYLLDIAQLKGDLLSSNMLLCLSLSQSHLSIWSLGVRVSPAPIFSVPPTEIRNCLNVGSPGLIFGQNSPCPCNAVKCQSPYFSEIFSRLAQISPSLQSPQKTGECILLGNYRQNRKEREKNIKHEEAGKFEKYASNRRRGEGSVGLCWNSSGR